MSHADVAQLVEHHLAKVRVAGSNLVVRSHSAWSAALLGSLTAFWVFRHAHLDTIDGMGESAAPEHGTDDRVQTDPDGRL